MPIGLGRVVKAIGKALGAGFPLASGNVVIGRMDRNRPLATSARRAGVDEVTIVATGTSRRAAQKASRTIDPVKVSSGGRTRIAVARLPRSLPPNMTTVELAA
jgi:hypothetical protein